MITIITVPINNGNLKKQKEYLKFFFLKSFSKFIGRSQERMSRMYVNGDLYIVRIHLKMERVYDWGKNICILRKIKKRRKGEKVRMKKLIKGKGKIIVFRSKAVEVIRNE